MSIIQDQTLYLNDLFEEIRETIQTQTVFANLLGISSFNIQDKSITYKTEKIYPNRLAQNTTPVVLVFSNPHPLSVQAGMYLSEPHSQAFWKRLFACRCMQPPEELWDSILKWSNNTINILSNHLLDPDYSDKITLFFDCLESLPTNQYLDLNKIFRKKKGRELRRRILQDPGVDHLYNVSHKNNITSWIVFSAQAYRNIVGREDVAKIAPKRIRSAIDQYQTQKDKEIFWKILEDLRIKIAINGQQIKVYLALIARRKNDKAKNGERYFTLMLDQIFKDITT
jgi:hypothetical protein